MSLDSALERLRAAAEQGLGVDPVPAELPPDRRAESLADGRDDVVRFDDLARERNPHARLLELRGRLAPGGTLVIGATQLAGAEHSELARFGRGDDGLWFVPGRLCFRRMVEAAEFVVDAESERIDVRGGHVHGYLRAQARR